MERNTFRIDRQTLEELNLLGRYRQGTVYYVFNKVRTTIGRDLLDRMFLNPLLDKEAINQRSATFQYTQHKNLNFTFEASQLTKMAEYLASKNSGNGLLAFIELYKYKLLAIFMRDERYRKTVEGLQATIGVLQSLYELLPQLSQEDSPLKTRVENIRILLNKPNFQKLRGVNIYEGLPFRKLAEFDFLLKKKEAKAMDDLMLFIAELDVYVSVAQVSKERGFNYATAQEPEDNVLHCIDLRHPCLDNAVGNDIYLKEGSNMLFLTGANMAGKSTWMKTLGIGLYLAHMGFPVPAESMNFSVRDGLYTSINVGDNVNLGYSHFFAEVMRVKQGAEAVASGARMMLLFDELFKGTNVKDAYDGTLSVTEGFAAYTDCLFVVSTHIIEVGEALRKLPNVQFRFMPTIMKGSVPQYTYKQQEGITEDRQGMMIIRNEGLLELMAI